MKKSIIIVLIAFFAASCVNSKSNIAFESKKVEFESTNDIRTATVGISFPFAVDTTSKKGQMVADSINKAITALLNPDAAIAEAKQMLRDSINFTNECEWSGVRNDKVVSFLFSSYLYAGGAHGGMLLRNLTFDAQTGKMLPLREQIKDTTKFLAIFLEEFYKENGITAQTTMEEIGYLVPLNELGIPSILSLTEDGLVCIYAQYEVAAYVVGMPSATIPYDRLEGVLDIDTKGLTQIEAVK